MHIHVHVFFNQCSSGKIITDSRFSFIDVVTLLCFCHLFQTLYHVYKWLMKSTMNIIVMFEQREIICKIKTNQIRETRTI